MYEIAGMIAGLGLVAVVLLSVVRTVLIPGRSASRMARWSVRMCTMVGSAMACTLPKRARGMVTSFSVPVGLFTMAFGWLVGLVAGSVLLVLALGGIADGPLVGTQPLAITPLEMIGVLTVISAALVLTAFAAYLVHFLRAYQRREWLVSRLVTRVSRVSDADALLADYLRAGSRENLDFYFAECAGWLADVCDSHVRYPGLASHRGSSRLCWPKAALIVMDAAALLAALAPRWAPPHTRVLLDVGTACLQRMAKQTGVAIPVSQVSLHGREERAFGDTVRLARESGLEAERDIASAWAAFQTTRVRYAPYAVLLETGSCQHGYWS